MRILTVLILGLLIVCVVDGSVVPDEALTASLQNVWNKDEFIIALSNIKARKKAGTNNSIESLLAVKYKQKAKMVLILDRRTKRVILENLDESGQHSVAHINVDSLAMNTPLKSLIILVHQSDARTRINSHVDVYVDCIYEGSIPLKKTFRDIAETEDPFVEVFRERKCRAKVYQSNINDALKKEKCPDNLIDTKQASTLESTKQSDRTKINSIDSNAYDKRKKSTDRPDRTDDDDGIKDGSDMSDQNNNSTPSTENDTKRSKHSSDKKSNKKDQYTHSSDRDRRKQKPRRPGSDNKANKYYPDGSFDPFSSGEMDNLDPGSLFSPFILQPSSTRNNPNKHLKKSPQSGTESNGSDQYSSRKPGRSGDIDGLDYPDELSLTSQLPRTKDPIQHPDKSRQTDSRPNKSDGLDSYEFDKNLFPTSDKSDVSHELKRPGRSTSRPRISDEFNYPDTDVLFPKRVPRRGDIGIQTLNERICQTDDQIVKTLNELINATRKLGRELELNRQETQHLRHLIENCAACRTPIVPPPPLLTCDPSPCYPGVECRETPRGPHCGPCIRGYTGNGWACTKINVITCADRPCFQGVRCYEDSNGYKCGRCPSGYIGDGKRCERHRNPCESHPCHPEVKCYPIYGPPYFECGPCPLGYVGNGTVCLDANECELARPCYPGVRCINLHPGYRCDRCPTGYTGPMTEGVGIEVAKTRKQICQDINECDINNGGCHPNSECINTEGSYRCGICKAGYIGNQTVGCRLQQDLCPNMVTACDINANCIAMYVNEYSCKCRIGWTGNGFVCGPDNDSDGIPDRDLHCHDRRCHVDNCPTIPNSGQEDTDRDGIGDACDADADNDGILNSLDNCRYHYNPHQLDMDNDKIGDECDNCPRDSNSKQEDLDDDGIGDVCDSDMDNDNVQNVQDNCVMVRNPDQRDTDMDGIGDICDNCPLISNPDQEDTDDDGVGNVCDTDSDRDRDGVQDDRDNCPDVPNPGQNDVDHDNIGNECDDDIDGDNVINIIDNCPYVYNPDQRDTNHDGIGDACWNDNDNDTVINTKDNCPNNSLIWTTDFRKYTTLNLDPYGTSQKDPEWKILHDGAEIWQLLNSDPGIAIGPDEFTGVDFEGTFYIDDDDNDDDFVGFVFSYQDSRHFYVVAWKMAEQIYWLPTPFRAEADPGIVLKLVQSETGPGEILRNSLWHKYDTPNQVKIIWTDPKKQGWQQRVSYRWQLIHRPKIGLIRFWLYQGTSLVTDSGNLFDSTLQGGKIGVYCFSQMNIIWSDLMYKCSETVPRYIWNQLPDNLKKEIEVQVETSHQQQIVQRMNYDF